MTVFFCSDLHFGHKNIQKFRPWVESEEHHRNLIKSEWQDTVSKQDVVYVLGDACFSRETLEDFNLLPGRKILVRGNHDVLDTSEYLKTFENVYGLLKYKEFWLSHAPIHPQELRGKVNLHGHVHYASIPDRRYLNCCVENVRALTGKCLFELQDIRRRLALTP